jgi:hypothetical protein
MLTATAPVDRAVRQVTAAHARAVSSASLEALRIAFGLLVAASALRFLARGWVGSLHLAPEHHLTYPGFDWVAPLPGAGASLHVAVVAFAGLAIAVGWRSRAALGVFLVAFVWMELIDAALYLNHYWLMTLLGALLFVLPVGRAWSFDAWTGRVTPSSEVPVWMVWAARSQVGIVYVVAGIAKLNADWLLRGEPLGMWLAARGDRPLVGSLFDLPLTPLVASWAGAIFDLTIVGWLVWRRSRPWAYVAVVVFHLSTAALFQIGLFPWAMMALTPVFFAPSWPERMLRRIGVVVPRPPQADAPTTPTWVRRAALGLVVVNLVVPLRHYAYAGDVTENEAGYYGSLRVMLTEKTGTARFLVTDPTTDQAWTVAPGDYFEPWQVGQLASRRDLLITAAHVVAAEARADGHPRVEVRADAWVSINGRQRRRLVDPALDLAALERRPR